MSNLRVKEMREAADLSMVELAKRAGLYPRTIRNVERGIHKPTLETIEKIADALGVPVHSLLGGKS